MRIQNIRLRGNENTKLAPNTIYAQLVDSDGSIVIMATLDYILAAIRDRNYEVEGVTVDKHAASGSVVRLVRYP